jgi:hypothetical protein
MIDVSDGGYVYMSCALICDRPRCVSRVDHKMRWFFVGTALIFEVCAPSID